MNQTCWKLMGHISFPTTGRLIGISSLALSTAFLLLVLPCASATDATFTGTGAGADWLTPGNWSTGAVPISGDTATVTGGLDALLTGGSSSLFTLNVSDNSNVTVSGSDVGLNVSVSGTYGMVNVGVLGSGSLTISNGASMNLYQTYMYIGAGTGDVGTVTIEGATFHSQGYFPVVVGSGTNSSGTVYVRDGALFAPGSPGGSDGVLVLADSVGSTGTVIQTGGTVSTAFLNFGSGTSVYRLEGGTLLTAQISTRYTGSQQGSFTLELASGTIQAAVNPTNLDNTFTINLRQGTTSTLDNNGKSLGVQSAITGSGALNVVGTGTLVLGGTNTYSGGTTLTQGGLYLQSSSALGSGTLTVTGNSTLTGGSSSVIIANNIQINSGVTLSTDFPGGTVLAGVISGAGGFDMASGSLAFSGSNTFTGGLILEGSGNLTFSGSSSLGKGTVTMRGGTLTWASGNTDDISSLVTLDAGTSIFNTNGNTVTFASALQGGGSFTKAGAGTLILSASNSSTANITLQGGTLRIANPDAIANSGTLIFNGGGFEGNGAPLTVANSLLLQSGNISGSSDLNFTGRVDFGSSFRILTVNNTGTTTFSGSLVGTGAGGFAKLGTGVLVISGTNSTYTGRTTVSAGTLVVNSLADIGVASSLGAPVTAANGTIAFGSGTLQYVGAGNSSNRSMSLGGVNAIDSSGLGALVLTGSVASAAGSTAKTLILTGTNTALNTISGTISNGATATVSFEKAGTGTWQLSGNNTYTGTTTISGGLLMAADVSSGSNNLGAGTSAVILGGAATSGTLAYTGNSATYTRGFSVNAGGGGFSVATAGQTLTLGTNGVSTAGVFTVSGPGNTAIGTSISGTGSLQKSGAGQLALSGSNSFSGGTLVTGGTLSVQSNNALGTGGVKVGGGVLSVEQGSSVTNAVSLAGGRYDRTLSGSLTDAVNASSDLGGVNTTARLAAGTLSSASTLDTSFSASSAATNDGIRRSDVYSFVGTGGDLFVLELSFSSTTTGSSLGWLSGNQWVNAVEGNTGNNATADMLNYNGSFAEFQIAYGTTLGDYVGAYGTSISGGVTTSWAVLDHNSDFAVIPEPGTVGLLALGASAVVLLRRRRQS